MPESPDMSAPVTHAQLHAALANVATKSDLELWGGALLDRFERAFAAFGAQIRSEMQEMRIELRSEMQEMRIELRTELRTELQATEHRLGQEMARHVSAFQEAMSAQIAVVDQKYADLPARVTRLER